MPAQGALLQISSCSVPGQFLEVRGASSGSGTDGAQPVPPLSPRRRTLSEITYLAAPLVCAVTRGEILQAVLLSDEVALLGATHPEQLRLAPDAVRLHHLGLQELPQRAQAGCPPRFDRAERVHPEP